MLTTLATRLDKDGVNSRHAIDVVATARDMDNAFKVGIIYIAPLYTDLVCYVCGDSNWN
jgi:hypothetical protein